MSKIAVFPGTFDPFHSGHLEVVTQARAIFDEVIILFADNPRKLRLFNQQEEMDRVQSLFDCQVTVDYTDGLVSDYCDKYEVSFIVRGLRSASDFDYEIALARINEDLNPYVRTIFLPTNSFVSSSFIRELYKHGKDYEKYLI